MRNLLVLLLVALAAVLLFWRLDGALLWRDEATTANWGRLMAKNGTWLPWVVDGDQLVAQASDGHDFSSAFLPAMQSWLQFYVVAAGFELFGVSTWTARLPFAVAGAACLFVLYRLGVALFGPGLRPFLPPYLCLLSIFFLTAARQCRYYILVVLAASLLLLEFCRYLREPERAGRRSFYFRIGLYGVFLYLSNYVSFAGMWAALTVFVVMLGDRKLLRGFVLLSAGMGVILGLEFWFLHSEFAESWPPPEPRSNLELYRAALAGRAKDLWRTIPVVLLVPGAFYLFWRQSGRPSAAATVAMILSVFIVLSPIVAGFDSAWVAGLSDSVFWLVALTCLTVPAALLYCWRKLGARGLWVRAALLAVLILLVSPLLTIAAGKTKAYTRHYYQILPAAILLGAVATAGLHRVAGRKAAGAFFAGLLVWPNLCFNFYGTEQIAERQLFRDRSYTEPFIEFLSKHVPPGAKVAFFRNVKGMTAYFYRPDIRWVALLDSEAPRNRQFRNRLPDDQFDDYAGAEWYVVWDPRGEWPKGLRDDYRKVWEYSYAYRQNFWDRPQPPSTRTFEIYRREPREGPASEPTLRR